MANNDNHLSVCLLLFDDKHDTVQMFFSDAGRLFLEEHTVCFYCLVLSIVVMEERGLLSGDDSCLECQVFG